MTDPIQQRPADADVIAARLKEYLEADYFAGAIRDVYAMINHIHFLEKQVASLKAAIARMTRPLSSTSSRNTRRQATTLGRSKTSTRSSTTPPTSKRKSTTSGLRLARRMRGRAAITHSSKSAKPAGRPRSTAGRVPAERRMA